MSSHEHTKEHSLANHTKKEMSTAAATTVHERESSSIQMAGQPLTSSSMPTRPTTNHHRSCLKHRPDGVDQQQHHDPSHVSPQKDETGRLSAGGGGGGHPTTGRVSFAHAALNDPSILNSPDVMEKSRRSALFAKKARELRLAELHYFKDHARDREAAEE